MRVEHNTRCAIHQAKAHTGTTTDIDLNKAAVAAGLARIEDGKLVNPFVGERFGLVAITTTFEMACDPRKCRPSSASTTMREEDAGNYLYSII